MKRDPALADLSREHLPALILAYRLRHGRSSNPTEPWPAEPAAQREAALALIHGEIAHHFAAEEQVLIPLKARLQEPGPSERVLADHQAFWALVKRIEAAEAQALSPLLCELGELLEAHIRFEERVWFEQLQQELAPEVLAAAGAALAAFTTGTE